MLTGQVFVSHAFDMAEFPRGRSFVQAVLDAVGRAGLAPVDMRYFAARDAQPAEYCRARVREGEVYVAVVGFRYGSAVPGQAVSYAELEFAEAGAAGLPRLVFLLDEAAGVAGRRVMRTGARWRGSGSGYVTRAWWSGLSRRRRAWSLRCSTR